MTAQLTMKNTVRYQYKSIVERLVFLRRVRKLSQEQIALDIGVDTKLFGEWERMVKYKKAKFIWCQEEPKNMGAWNTVKNYIERTLEMINLKDINIKFVGRSASSTTATGNANKHLAQQKEILEKIFKH